MIPKSTNKVLKDRFGHDLLGRPHFRVVWSDDQIERRMGTFHEFYGDIFVRSRFGVDDVPKYQKYAEHSWVLERLTWIPRNLNKELVPLTDDGATYEPVYVYSTPPGDMAPPPMKALIFTIHCFRNPQKYTPADFARADKEAEDKEVEDFVEIMDDDLPLLSHGLADGSAVSFSNLDAPASLHNVQRSAKSELQPTKEEVFGE